MFFTQEDYKKIEEWLRRNSIKDSEFEITEELTDEDTIVVVSRGKNKKITFKNINKQFEVIVEPLNKYISNIENEDITSDGVGGIPANTTLKNLNNKSISEILDDLIFPTKNPTHSLPSVTLSFSSDKTVVPINSKVITASQGTYDGGQWLEYNDNLPYVGTFLGYEYLIIIDNTWYPFGEFPEQYKIAGDNTYQVTAKYDKGFIPKNNKGAEVPELQYPGGSVTKTYIINVSYPYYVRLNNDTSLIEHLEKCVTDWFTYSATVEMTNIKDSVIKGVKVTDTKNTLFKVHGTLTELYVYDSFGSPIDPNNSNSTKVSNFLDKLESTEIIEDNISYTLYKFPDDMEIGDNKIFRAKFTFKDI